ncbi:MAG: citrate lyase beta subunit [Magnetococcales bacterium]|nr:citrate lyase beta subunit [Magnetococcales bacterium]
MNELEHEMVDLLTELRDRFGVYEIKAEFEAEGSRMEEMMRLKEVIGKAGLPLILKIGGVEAVTDVYNALSLGVKGIIAPMAETPYSVSKFLNLIDHYIAPDNAKDIEFAINLETITAYHNLDAILSCPGFDRLAGITVGRVDMVGSMGLSRAAINTSEELFGICRDIFSKARARGLKTALGGGIEKEALPIIERLNAEGLLDKYETRKIVFRAESAKLGEIAILKAVKFELQWLKSKRRYYSGIRSEDEKRIAMLERRVAGL